MAHHDYDWSEFSSPNKRPVYLESYLTHLQPHRKVPGRSFALPMTCFLMASVGMIALAALWTPAAIWWALGWLSAGFVSAAALGLYGRAR